MKAIHICTFFCHHVLWFLPFSVNLLCTSLLLYILEDVTHINKINGYQMFAHNPNPEDISQAIRETLATKRTNVRVKLNSIKQDIMEEADFEERCTAYFEENFETLAAESPLILPCKEPEKFKQIINTMGYWCRKTNKSSNIKGLVLHSFSVFQLLEHFGLKEALKDSLKIKVSSKQPVIVVYNPQENVLLLIRNAENQELTTDIKHGLDDLMMFILLFHDKLQYSNLKLISLIVTDNSHDFKLKCQNCINNVITLEEFKDLPTFENWWVERATHFEIESLENINPDFIKSFLAKITGTVAATFIYGDFIPTMTDKPDEQIANLAVLLTREQMEIVYSQDKHIIIRGGFGCGKTIIAGAILKKISESLKNDEKLYYICYDSRSELLDHMTKGDQKIAKRTLLHNKEGRNLSEIIKGVLEKKESTTKVNFLVDEYDGEDLDESEAKNLNKVFNELLKETFILLIVQPIEKKRVINNILQNRNRFDLLENMKVYQLNRVMRNSVEIHKLVKLTTDVFQKQQTVFVHQEGSKTKEKPKSRGFLHGVYSNLKCAVSGKKTVAALPKPSSDVTAKLPSRPVDSFEYPKEKVKLDEARAFPGSVKRTHYAGTHKYPEENLSIPKLGLDEAQAVSGFTEWTGSGGVRTISKFLFATTDKTGHKISSKKPTLFELGDRSNFQKIQSLIAIFEKRRIQRRKEVILHFNTGSNEIPDNFLFIFQHHFKMQGKVTKRYEEFKSKNKSILVCSYPTFRGLEHQNITVIIDCDIYYVQHYLVEALARCTCDLCIVILQNSKTLADVTAEWKNNQAIQQWGIEISEDTSQVEEFEFELIQNKNSNIINAKFRPEYYKKLEEIFMALVNEDKKLESIKKLEARKIIRQR